MEAVTTNDTVAKLGRPFGLETIEFHLLGHYTLRAEVSPSRHGARRKRWQPLRHANDPPTGPADLDLPPRSASQWQPLAGGGRLRRSQGHARPRLGPWP
jgi:hypothetical protein